MVADGNGRVTGLNLRAYGLRGAIPLGLELPNLRDWNLDDNAGLNEGCIPESLRDVDGSNSESLGLPYCGDTCAYGGALPAPTNGMLVDDCEALLRARNALLRGEDDLEKLNWSTREPIENWRGITVGGVPQRVIKLEIVDRPNGRELSGLISRELARLSALQVLNLDGQGMDGEIPAQLGDLANLQTLSLESNLLDGRIPSSLSSLKRLNVLNLSDNYLSGRIPGKLQNLVDNLKTLKLAYNAELNDCIPERLMSVPDNDLAELELEVCGTVATWVSDDPSFDPAWLEAGGGAVTVDIRTQELKGTPTPVTAPSMSVSGPGLDLTNTASPCAEAQREIGSYIERCWTVTFEAPPNESTTSANSYEVTVRSDLVQGNPVGEITVAAAPAILEKPGEPETEPEPGEVGPGTEPSLPVITLPLTIGVVLPEIELDYDDDDDGDDEGDDGTAPVNTVVSGSAASDRAVLVALYNATDGPNWRNNNNWLTDEPMREWDGVTTDSKGRVTRLALPSYQLTGEIPAELGNLSNLTYLDLWGSQLTGEIPAELGNLSNLTSLNLVRNQLTGEIPAELGNLSNLTYLDLRDNGLTGEIPAELGNLSNLTSLKLNSNQLTGEIPAELGNLSNLGRLWLCCSTTG